MPQNRNSSSHDSDSQFPTITVTEIGEFVRFQSCERRFKLGLNKRALARRLPFSERLFNALDPVLHENARIKKVAEGLYSTLQKELAKIQDFTAKQAIRDEIKIIIKDYLWEDKTGIPESFAPDEIDEKTDAVLSYLLLNAPYIESRVGLS